MSKERPPARTAEGVFSQILSQDRAPVCAALCLLVSLVAFLLMLFTYARWHTNLGFALLSMPFLYGGIALIGAAMNGILAWIAVLRRERYVGGVATAASIGLFLAAYGFARATLWAAGV